MVIMVAYGHQVAMDLPARSTGPRATGWWAIVLLVLIEIMVFASLIVSYLYLYSTAPEWPPSGIDPPKLLLPTINAVILLATVPLVRLAAQAISEDNLSRFNILMAAGTVMLIVFLTLKAIEYRGLSYQWDTHAYGSIVWMITGFHTAHIITVILKSSVIQVLAWKGFFSSQRRAAIDGNTLYWTFVALIWIPLFATLYLFPTLI
jgi:cytochrome c oxidase subunit III